MGDAGEGDCGARGLFGDNESLVLRGLLGESIPIPRGEESPSPDQKSSRIFMVGERRLTC